MSDVSLLGAGMKTILLSRKINHISGVYDRMINMSQPIHKKYNVAITKQLGRYMEAIVVDTESTARQCIQYLKVGSLKSRNSVSLGCSSFPTLM